MSLPPPPTCAWGDGRFDQRKRKGVVHEVAAERANFVE